MSSLYGLLSILSIFVLPVWLILHYRSRNIELRYGVPAAELQRLREMEGRVESLDHRLLNLEQILDEQRPAWRETL
ncbi:MAG: envelope stress response membrane protein PspB [Gammaproteobacteria bacterium]|nr:envelope stress response membrane protein PspB [Gammaproteobacteria bacterium]